MRVRRVIAELRSLSMVVLLKGLTRNTSRPLSLAVYTFSFLLFHEFSDISEKVGPVHVAFDIRSDAFRQIRTTLDSESAT
jgi:hypothetical protein